MIDGGPMESRDWESEFERARATVARLEGDAALAAALRDISGALGAGEKILSRQRRPELAEAYHRIKEVADVALSDGGKGCEHEFTGGEGAYPGQWSRCLKCNQMALRPGEGWLPPEVREQVRQALIQAIRDAKVSQRSNPDDLPAITTTSLDRLRTALDALGGKPDPRN